MSSPHELFADTINDVTLSGGMVRIDLVSLDSPSTDTESSQPAMALRQRVVMPPDGFLHAFSLLENLIRQLEEKGVISRNQGDTSAPDAPVPASETDASPEEASQNASPNFQA